MFKILVVEDDQKLNEAVCATLKQNGFDAAVCTNGNEAYDRMYRDIFDLIVSDIMMPGVDGFELAETVRELNQIVLLFALLKISAKAPKSISPPRYITRITGVIVLLVCSA